MKKRVVVITMLLALALVMGSAQFTQSTEAQGDYSGHTVALGFAEIITDPLSGQAGGIQYFRSDLGNGQLTHDFVYGDPRRASFNGGNAGVTFAVKTGFQSTDANLTNQIGWLRDSVRIWDAQTCANVGLTENSVNPGSPGLVANFFATGVLDIGLVQADITQIGFLGVSSIFPPNTNVLGVTYTLFWVDANGNLTDIDNNGKVDAALREIYYNDQYEWADNGTEGTQPSGVRVFDFPTVAIHEAGHGFSAAHFGNIGYKDGALIANPRSIMNAIYGGTLRTLEGRDIASTCSNWAQWPRR